MACGKQNVGSVSGGNLNPGVSFKGNKPQISYDTRDKGLKKSDTEAYAETVPTGIQFHFKAGEHNHTSAVIPPGTVVVPKKGLPKPKLTFVSGNVNALYEIEVTDQDTFASKF